MGGVLRPRAAAAHYACATCWARHMSSSSSSSLTIRTVFIVVVGCAAAAGGGPPGSAPVAGTCGGTKWAENWQTQCQSASCGAIHARANNITSLGDCVAACRRCAACSFVSFQQGTSSGASHDHDDCSWYTNCPTTGTSPRADMDKYRSQHVKQGHAKGAGIGSCKIPPPPLPPPPPHKSHYVTAVSADWVASAQLGTTSVAATVEVDVMPFMSRRGGPNRTKDNNNTLGGPFKSYFAALRDLGSEFTRFAPWYGYPKTVVAELRRPNCSAGSPIGAGWNSSILDGILSDFMAANGNRSVAMQISTVPSWMMVGGTDPDTLPEDPWSYSHWGDYNKGKELVDKTCGELATYIARMVSWYTRGGMVDACGKKRQSGFFFKWAALSVLNDDPPIDTIAHADEYILCFDAITEAVHSVDPELKTMGPEQWPSPNNLEYYKHFMNGANHKDGKPPQLISAHHVSHHDDKCEERFP